LQDVLGLDRIGLHDNFFEQGGNSLLLVRAHARLSELIGGDLQVVDLFSHPTVALLAAHAGRQVATVSVVSAARQSDERMDKVEAGQSRLQKLRQRRQQG
ncbi:MAG TPA: phosphopantetheine-binding protein, partial [Thermoanaerobaculia bacterium]|nr:phosphopantetheine-binding protein [Thermoanaerobaculia bacterium]